MLINFLIYLTVFVGLVGSTKPTIKLSFNPDERFYARDSQVEIQCEILNPNEKTDSSQLWHIDLRTGKRTALSRMMLSKPSDDVPEILKNNKNNRYEIVRKSHIRIRRLHMEDSARYECDCPDCEENISKDSRELHVVKIAEPMWLIEPGLPFHENTRASIKCVAEDFYPYVGHRILRNHLEITNDGRSLLSNEQIYPQKFVWETAIQLTPEWHNVTIRCIITEGNVEQQTSKTLNVLFNPRFIQCDEKQYVDETKDQSILSCSFSGNPAPTVTWRRAVDKKPIENGQGINIQTIDEFNGKYKTMLKLERSKFPSNENISGEALFKEYLKSDFIVQLTVNGNDRGTRSIQIVRHANQIRSSLPNNGKEKKRFCLVFICSVMILNGLSTFFFF